MTPRFAVFYADGSVVEGGGEDDEFVEVTIRVSRDWLEAPAARVLGVVAEQGDISRVVLRGVDFYYPLEDGEYGFADHLAAWSRKMGGVVKEGEYVSDRLMAGFWAWAKEYRWP
jgi:hypothetical protein